VIGAPKVESGSQLWASMAGPDGKGGWLGVRNWVVWRTKYIFLKMH
jgi:hypothetical protein